MLRRVAALALAVSFAAAAAHAQMGPYPGGSGPGGSGQGGPGGGRHGGQRGQPPSGNSQSATTPPIPPPKPVKPENQIEITGVVAGIDAGARRVTIAYDAVDELGWPRGTLPFVVYRADMLTPLTVGERVRFRLDAQQITEIGPY